MYVPLRVHGHHSMLTGVDSPAELCARAAALGLPALALADVDSLAGVVEFLEAARASSVRPIVAAELSDPGGKAGRLVALVETEEGWRNLCRLVSARQLGSELGADPGADPDRHGSEGFDLARAAVEHQGGLFFLADHPRLLLDLYGRVPGERLFAAISPASLARARSSGGLADPRERAGGFVDAHGRVLATRNTHRVPAARAETPYDPDVREENPLDPKKTPPPARAVPALELVEAARAVGVATLAVPDVYYSAPSGERDHRVRVAIKHNALIEGLPREWLAESPAHLLGAAEMCALYADLPDVPGEAHENETLPPEWSGAQAARGRKIPGAVCRTLALAARCKHVPPLGGVLFPEIALEKGETAYSRMCALAFEGARTRFRPLRPEVVRRLDYELSTIDQLGYAPYFLLVKGIADFARARGIPCVGRGSAADSLVAYCLQLTDADPFRYRLPFERFLNPSRRDRPDIDLDFCWRRRDEVLAHVFELFGAERTAMISTLNRFGLRSAFREAALVHGLPPVEVNRWSARLPHWPASTFDGSGSEYRL